MQHPLVEMARTFVGCGLRLTTTNWLYDKQHHDGEGDVPMKLFQPLAVVCLLATAGAAHAADPNLGRNLAATCANCHGTNGQAVKGSGMDALAGMDKARILQKLADYMSGDKPASIMHQIATVYTEAQRDLIAGYFASQK